MSVCICNMFVTPSFVIIEMATIFFSNFQVYIVTLELKFVKIFKIVIKQSSEMYYKTGLFADFKASLCGPNFGTTEKEF